jgi:hypothetical protein
MPKPTSDCVTVLNANALGGRLEYGGRSFILATLSTLQKPDFWQLQGQNVGLVVNCIGKRNSPDDSAVLPDAAGRPLQVFIDVHNKMDSLPTAFNTACQATKETFDRGKDVLVHCRLTFHRGPIIAAGLYQNLCGVSYQVEIYRGRYGWATLIVPKGGGLSGYYKASGGLIKPL